MGNVQRYKIEETSGDARQISIFGPPPLSKDEDLAAYNELLKRLTDLFKPADIIEEILIRDYVDNVWDRRRWRHKKAGLMTHAFSCDLEKNKYDHVKKFPIEFEILERADRLTALAERRCQAILRELEYYRCELSQILSNRTLQIGNDTTLKPQV
jgi:hypothetical protein